MNEYSVIKPCFLGEKKTIVKLNDRQAAFLLAGGFIELLKAKTTKKVV